MTSRQDLVAAAHAHGFKDEASVFAQLARRAWRLSLRTPGPEGIPLGASKVGGCPDMAPGESWPRNARGVPLVFVAQLAPAEFPPLAPADQEWGHRGELIRLFADLLEDPHEPGRAAGLSTVPAHLERRVMPAHTRPLDLDDGTMFGHLSEFPERAVAAEIALTVPAVHPGLRDTPNHWMDPLSRRYDTFAAAVDPERLGRSQVLGWPPDGQEDPLAIGPCVEDGYDMAAWTTQPADWRLLLLLHYSPTSDGDLFKSDDFYALVIRATDLAAGRYDRLAFVFDFG